MLKTSVLFYAENIFIGSGLGNKKSIMLNSKEELILVSEIFTSDSSWVLNLD